MWQFDFSEFETLARGTWRVAGVADYWSKYEFGWHWSRVRFPPKCEGIDNGIAMSEKRMRYDREFREGAVRSVEETKKPIA